MKKLLSFVLALIVIGAAAAGVYAWRQTQGIDPAILEAKYMTPADRFVEVAGMRLRVREEGPQDAPVLILLHGFSYSLESWDAWAAALSDRYRVIRYDLRGHGLTGPDPQKRYSPAARAAFVGDVMDALGIDSAYVGGNSLGGLAAWKFAAAHPERVKALILVSPAAYPTNGVGDKSVEPPRAMAAYLRTATPAGVRASAGVVFADDAKISEARLVILRDMLRRRGNGEAMIESIRQFALQDPAAELSKIDAPALILWGSEDAVIPVEQGRRLEGAIRNARLVIYDGVGHAPQEEAPEISARDAGDFLDALVAGMN